jgi:CubicO group peptidase (beta-lactamase class C family)
MRGALAMVAGLAVALGAHAAPTLEQAAMGGDWRDDVDRMAERLVSADLVPGVGVAVAVGD